LDLDYQIGTKTINCNNFCCCEAIGGFDSENGARKYGELTEYCDLPLLTANA